MIYGFLPENGILSSGTGKTLSMIKIILENYKKNPMPIFSNINLTNTPYSPITRDDIIKSKMDHLTDKILILDEITQFADSRGGNSKKSREFHEKVVLQNRHMKTDIYWSAQHMDMVDKRLLRATAYIFMCRPLQMENPIYFQFRVFSRRIMSYTNLVRYDGRKYFNEYNTYELVGNNSEGLTT